MKRLNRIGSFLSRIVFQNISVLIALGMIRVLFGPTGWFPQEEIFSIVNPLIKYFIPILFAFTGGKMIGDYRGGVMAAFVMLAMVARSPAIYSMILPAMVIGPLVGYIINKVDKWLEGRIPIGFELLFYNVVAGFIGMNLAIFSYLYLGPLFIQGMHSIIVKTEFLITSGYLPLIAIIIEPGKVLFFNNIINHGILEPLGINQTTELGKSIFFLLETNPGPGAGLLLAYYFLYNGKEKDSIKSLMIIEFLGGIHEVYFPYALMKPLLVIPLILSGMTGDFIFYLFNAGLVATPSPGSIFVLIAMAPKGAHIAVLAGIIASALVSFLGSLYVLSREKPEQNECINQDRAKNVEWVPVEQEKKQKQVKKIIFACDAGMGSSAMGAALLRKKLKQANLEIAVDNASVDDIPADADLVISHLNLTERAKKSAPNAEHLSITSFVDQYFYQQLIARLQVQQTGQSDMKRSFIDETKGFTLNHILLHMTARDKWEAIEQVGNVLVKMGNVDCLYIEEMKQREQILSTYIGNGVAVPHGIDANSERIKEPGIAIAQYPKGIDFGNGNKAYILIAIAGRGSQQLTILSYLAVLIERQDKVQQLIQAQTQEEIFRIIKESFTEGHIMAEEDG